MEPSGPVQACNGTDLLFFNLTYTFYIHTSVFFSEKLRDASDEQVERCRQEEARIE